MEGKVFSAAVWSLGVYADQDPAAIPGLLKFEGDKFLELEIPTGALLDWPLIPTQDGYVQSHVAGGLHADQAFGFSQDGKYYLLRDVSTLGPSVSYPGFQKQELRGASLFVSRQPIVANPIIQSATIRIPGLREWVGKVPFKVSSKYVNGKFSEINFSFRGQDTESLPLYESEEVRVSIEQSNLRKGGPIPSFTFEFETEYELRIEFKESGLHFDEALDDWVFRTTNFLAFCMGYKRSIDALSIVTTEGAQAEYYAPFVGPAGPPSRSQINSMPFSYNAIKEDLNVLLYRWYRLDDYAKSSSTLLISLMHDKVLPLDMRFIASAQAFEAASRSEIDEKEISDKELERRLRDIRDSKIEEKLKKWILYKLGHAKWRSANSLARSLIEHLEPFTSFVVPDLKRFLKEHRVNRDAYTHRRALDDANRLFGEGLLCNVEATELLTYGAVAFFIGLSPDEIVESFKRSHYRSASLNRIGRQYPDCNQTSNDAGDQQKE